MPRDASGNYTLPALNPVATGTNITVTWANNTMTDLSQGVTDSMDRSGRGSMLAAFKGFAGTVGLPGLTFSSETTTGWSRPSAGQLSGSVLGAEVFRVTASAATFLQAPTYAADPGAADVLSRKAYVDAQIATRAPLTGTGASGTWGINISGNAATATNATNATNAATAASCSGNAATATVASSTTNVTSGTYTPIITLFAGSGSYSPLGLWRYTRVGNVVTVTGCISASGMAASATQLRATLPIASAFTNLEQASGAIGFSNGIGSGVVIAEVTGDRLDLLLANSAGSYTIGVSCQYDVL